MARPTSRIKSPNALAVAALRRRLHFTQEDLARELHVSPVSVARWESALPPTGKSLERLAEYADAEGAPACAKTFRRLLKAERDLARREQDRTQERIREIVDTFNLAETNQLLYGLWSDAQDLTSADIGMRLGAVAHVREGLLKLADLLMIDGRKELTGEEQ